MTLEEVCERLGKSPNTLKKNFKRTQENLAKQGVRLTRIAANNYSIDITDSSKVQFTISQLIQTLKELQKEIGEDAPVYRLDGSDKSIIATYRLLPMTFDNVDSVIID